MSNTDKLGIKLVTLLKLSLCAMHEYTKKVENNIDTGISEDEIQLVTLSSFIVLRTLVRDNEHLSQEEFSQKLFESINDTPSLVECCKTTFKDVDPKKQKAMQTAVNVKLEKEFVFGLVNSAWK